MDTTTTTRTPISHLRVHSVAADEGMIWSLTDDDGRLVGTAAAAFAEPISAADLVTVQLEAWVAPGLDADSRWERLLGDVLAALFVLDADRVVADFHRGDDERLAHHLAAGFRVRGVDRNGTTFVVAERSPRPPTTRR